MAQILAPSPQWQMRITKNSTNASQLTSKMCSSLFLKQNKKATTKTSAKYRVLAIQSKNSTINRMGNLLNMDITPYTNKIIAEYIWIGGSGIDLRSKSRAISSQWNTRLSFQSGTMMDQVLDKHQEKIVNPQAMFKDPFHGGNNILVICDTYTLAGEPIPTNKRNRAAEIFSNKKVVDEIPWLGIEQEYTLLQTNVKWPSGWHMGGYPGPQGPYYCSAGANKSFGRDISDAHYKACLYAGINISGTNGEVMPGQWEFQVGPSVGIEAGDHIWCARYILERTTEQAGVVLSLDPKPIEGDWNGAGCHTNYSTKTMREEGGYEVIKKAILNLLLRHKEHISAYGVGNERRLTGKHETASIDTFSWGVANRGCSICVGRETEKQGKVASLSIPLHIFPIYFPFGNMATGFLVIFSLIAGSVGFMTSLANINNVFHWNPSNLQAAAASSLTTWLLTMLAMGVACKEISLGWTDSNLRTLETILIVLSGTQLFCYGTIHMGVEDAVTRQRTGRGRFM